MRPPSLSRNYKRYTLAVMTTVYMLSLVDRGLMVLLLQPIKEDLQLSDTQLGLVTGIAFAMFYATLGVPIARWADRGNRVSIASLAMGLWGLTVMACLFVTNYSHLVLARVLAAVGESGCKPPTYSLLGDYYPEPAKRIRAMAIYLAGNFLSYLLAFVVAGKLNEMYGWRVTFFVMGIPGILLAVLVKMTIIEPRELARDTKIENSLTLRSVLRSMWHQQSTRHLCIALILFYTMMFGLGPWYAAFMIRTHGLGTAELGVWLGFIFGLGGVAGVLLGSYVANRWLIDNERGQMRLSAAAVVSVLPCIAAFLILPRKYHALASLIPMVLIFSTFLGPTYALLQRLVVDEVRATAMALVMLLANLVGMGLAPLAVGILSDALVPVAASDSLRYAILIISSVGVWSGYHFWLVSRTVERDLAIHQRACARYEWVRDAAISK